MEQAHLVVMSQSVSVPLKELTYTCNTTVSHTDRTQINKKFRKFERKYRDCIKRKGDKIGTQTCYDQRNIMGTSIYMYM